MLKVDMLKTYDRVSWEFVITVLRTMGFHETWIGWVEALITSACDLKVIRGFN
ncbi:hypothetical protein LINPERHAP1_LOCUS16020 [Linum perenne]